MATHVENINAKDSSANAKDPVCGMKVDPATTSHHATHAGTDFHFCSARCRDKFVAEPQVYTKSKHTAPPTPVDSGTIYTCPMHPQIRQVGPGACPI